MNIPDKPELLKPIFEYSDMELKSIAYEEMKIIQKAEQNIKLIESELQRRKLANVVGTVKVK